MKVNGVELSKNECELKSKFLQKKQEENTDVSIKRNIRVDSISITNITVKIELEKNKIIIQYRKLNLVVRKSHISLDDI